MTNKTKLLFCPKCKGEMKFYGDHQGTIRGVISGVNITYDRYFICDNCIRPIFQRDCLTEEQVKKEFEETCFKGLHDYEDHITYYEPKHTPRSNKRCKRCKHDFMIPENKQPPFPSLHSGEDGNKVPTDSFFYVPMYPGAPNSAEIDVIKKGVNDEDVAQTKPEECEHDLEPNDALHCKKCDLITLYPITEKSQSQIAIDKVIEALESNLLGFRPYSNPISKDDLWRVVRGITEKLKELNK